jgi:hypothetical protein
MISNPENDVTTARMITESLLVEAQAVEEAHAAVLADPGLGPLVARTADLVEHAGYIESLQADEQRDIVEAHRRHLSVAQWRDQVEAAVAYAESWEYAAAIWEDQGEQYAAAYEDDAGERWEDQGDAYGVQLGDTAAAAVTTAPRQRTHLPASERTIREHLADLPDWMIDECIGWTREREGRGWQFTSGTAAAIHWLDDAQRARPGHPVDRF